MRSRDVGGGETSGVIWCNLCGAYAESAPRALARPCQGHTTRAGKVNISWFIRGWHPRQVRRLEGPVRVPAGNRRRNPEGGEGCDGITEGKGEREAAMGGDAAPREAMRGAHAGGMVDLPGLGTGERREECGRESAGAEQVGLKRSREQKEEERALRRPADYSASGVYLGARGGTLGEERLGNWISTSTIGGGSSNKRSRFRFD